MKRQSLAYRPEIDGLRGIAVALVIVYHAFPGYLSGGWVGVDVFFVISGYLITSIIVRDLNAGKFSFKNFYQRRVRRLAPAFVTVLGVSAAIGWFVLPFSFIEDFGERGFAALTGWANIHIWANSGYLAGGIAQDSLGHTWSLSVEEQFYLLFPVAMVVFYRLFGRPGVYFLIVVGLLSSGALAIFGGFGANTVYLWFPTRAWELLAGAMLVMVPPVSAERHRALRRRLWLMVGVAGAMAVFLSALYNPGDGYTPFHSLAPVLGATAIISASRVSSLLQKILTFRPLVLLGLISYSVYLWHQPLLVFARSLTANGSLSFLQTAGVIGFALMLAFGTWKFVEIPFRDSENAAWSRNRPRIAVSSVLVGVLMIGLHQGFVPSRTWDVHSTGVPNWEVGTSGPIKEWWRALPVEPEGGWYSDIDDRSKILIVGNSHAADIYNVLSKSKTATRNFQIGRFPKTQIWTLKDDANPFFMTNSYETANIVLFASRYSEADLDALESVVRRIQADGKSVAIVENMAEPRLEVPLGWIWIDKIAHNNQSAWPDMAGLQERINSDYFEAVNETSQGKAISHTNEQIQKIGSETRAVVLDRMDYICRISELTCYAVGGDLEKYFIDSDHHSVEGHSFFAQRVDEVNWLNPILQQRQ